MVATFEECVRRIAALSSEELDRSVVDLVGRENRTVALVIAHLAEISRRKLDLERGYRGLFDYGVRRLGLSEGSVARRVQVAYIVRRFPQVLEALAGGRISLTVAGLIAPQVREDNVDQLLAACAGMTRREVDAYLVSLRPRAAFGSSIRKLQRSRGVQWDAPTPSLMAPATPQLYNFRFAASKEFKLQLERLGEVLGIPGAARNLPSILETAVELALEARDPQRRLERRRERQGRQAAASPGAEPSSDRSCAGEGCVAGPALARSRHVPVAARDRVFERAGYQCQFTAPDGTRCSARADLEIEHDLPFAIHHHHDEENLLVLCSRHNRLRAEQVYGAEYIQARIEARRREEASG